MDVGQGALRLAREGSAAALRAKPGGGPGIPRFFFCWQNGRSAASLFAGRAAVLRHRFFFGWQNVKKNAVWLRKSQLTP
jgi:hypothetical protein